LASPRSSILPILNFGYMMSIGHRYSNFGALIYLTNEKLFPLQLVLREVLLTNSMEEMLTGVAKTNVIRWL
jgi:hypothetical protein